MKYKSIISKTNREFFIKVLTQEFLILTITRKVNVKGTAHFCKISSRSIYVERARSDIILLERTYNKYLNDKILNKLWCGPIKAAFCKSEVTKNY